MATGASTSPSPALRWIWQLTAAVIVLLGVWVARFGPEPSADDYAQYLMHAQALLDGRPYGDIGYVFSNYAWGVGPPIAPPGLSLSLVPVLATVGSGLWIQTALMLLAVGALAGLTALYFGRWNPVHATAAAFLIVVSLILQRAGATIYPDVPFAVLCWLVVVLADGEEYWSGRRMVAIGAIGVAAILFRTAGMALIPSMILFGIISYKSLGMRPFVLAVVWGATFFLTFNVFGAGRFPAVPPDFVTAGGPVDDPGLVSRLVANALRYRWPLFDLQLYPVPWRVPNAIYHVAITGVSAWALLRWVEGAWYRFGVVFMLGYAGMLLTVPVQSGRYFWPMLPFGAFAMVRALDLITRIGPLARASLAGRVMAPLLIVSVMAVGTKVADPPEPGLLQRDSVRDLFERVEGIHANDPNTRVAFMKPRTMAWHTGVPTMAVFNPPSSDIALSELGEQRITHVVVGTLGMDEFMERRWEELLLDRPDRFDLEYRNADFELYSLVPDGS